MGNQTVSKTKNTALKTHGLVQSTGLHEEYLKAIRQLEEICNKQDGLCMKLNPSLLAHRPGNELNDFLYFDHGKLIGYIALFIFNNDAAEISGMVHPEYRNRGIFSKLLTNARNEILRRGIPKALFICEGSSSVGAEYMNFIEAKYTMSEYKMQLGTQPSASIGDSGLILRKAVENDINALFKIDRVCFDPSIDMDYYKLETILKLEDRLFYVGEVDGKVIGKITAAKENNSIAIYGFGLLPEYRGKGYGRQMLSLILKELQKHSLENILLEVACENNSALSLYKSCGFEVITNYDYYELEL